MDRVDATCQACALEGRETPLRWAPDRPRLCDDHLRQLLLQGQKKGATPENDAEDQQGKEKSEALPAMPFTA